MATASDLSRFVEAQAAAYEPALAEIRRGRKRGHWMWYIFPQIQGRGFSETSRFYAIQNLAEALAYAQHPVLGSRLVRICEALVALASHDATGIFGSPDDVKLKSSMTLFAALPGANPVFQQVLDKFFGGRADGKTLQLLGQPQ